ncbi:20331_t:CDS:2 [Racocetra persica]|uniref:20331_t:CDS:1 n=1 Tax=Racocetra persica TaxID=160502 RepID=A0ACA9KDJ4_9GLOM|nr:20331_t:CDS:2 [Racocetra persica]
MSSQTPKIIIDEVFNKLVPKPINLRPEYDLEYVKKYYVKCGSYNYNCVENICKLEKRYNDLAIIRPYETPQHLLNETYLLTSPLLPPKPFAYIQRRAGVSSFIDVDGYWASVRKNTRKEIDLISFD